jgi:hypothetical protein
MAREDARESAQNRTRGRSRNRRRVEGDGDSRLVPRRYRVHETYKNVVKMTFAKAAVLKDPSGLFNSSLDGNVAPSTSTKATRSMRRP